MDSTWRSGLLIGGGVLLGFLVGLEIGQFETVRRALTRVGNTPPVKTVADVGRDIVDGTSDAAKTLLSDQMAAASDRIRAFAEEESA